MLPIESDDMKKIINKMVNNEDTVLKNHNFIFETSDIAVVTNVAEMNTACDSICSRGVNGNTLRFLPSSTIKNEIVTLSFTEDRAYQIPVVPRVSITLC